MKIIIENFKSIDKLELDLSRINILIGPPNAGKSNILEALALYGFPFKLLEVYKYEEYPYTSLIDEIFKKVIRFRKLEDLYYEEEKGYIKINDLTFKILRIGEEDTILLDLDGIAVPIYRFTESEYFKENKDIIMEKIEEKCTITRLYKFHEIEKIDEEYPKSYLAENFQNFRKIVWILNKNKLWRKVKEKYEIDILPDTYPLYIYDIANKRPLSFKLLSDGLQRFSVILALIISNIIFKEKYNKDIILLLEEPETNMYSYLASELGEIVLRSKLSYVISTHNPYFVRDLVIKAVENNMTNDVRIFKVVRAKGKTKIEKSLNGEKAYSFMEKGYDLIEDILEL